MARFLPIARLLQVLQAGWGFVSSRRPRASRSRVSHRLNAPRLEPLEQRILLTASVGNWSTREEVIAWIGDRNYVPDEVIVALHSAPSATESTSPLPDTIAHQVALSATLGSLPVETSSGPDASQATEQLVSLKLAAGSDVASVLQQLSQDASVAWAAPNFVYTGPDPRDLIPNDPSYSSQYHHTRMQTTLAWDTTLGSSNVIIAVTDDGTDWDHVDLAANIWNNSGEIAGNGIDDDANGFIDDIRGWDFSSNDNDPNHVGTNYHGTHVAGIIGARTNNAIGVAGTAGGATVMPVRFYGSGAWTSTVIFNSYKYATDNGAKIISTSYSIDSFVGDPTFTSALDYAYSRGVLHFNSAGNNSQLNPPRQTFDQMVFVASTESNDTKSGFSNYGYGTDIAAPGGSIYATLPGDTYGTLSGTSMATPNAAAVAGLIWSVNPTWTRDQVAAQLMATADNIDSVNPLYAGNLGSGRANAFRAVTETIAAPKFKGLVEVPTDGMTLTTAPTTITVSLGSVFSEAGLENAGNFELRSDGADNVFDTGDDVVVPLTRMTNYMIGSNRLAFTIGSTLGVDRYRFRALSSGVSSPFGVALDGDGNGTAGGDFVRTFNVELPVGVASLSPTAGSFVSLPLTSIDVNFDKPYGTASIGTSDLILSQGTVTGFTLIDADTVRYTLSGITRDGSLSIQLPAGAVTDISGNASTAYAGSLIVDVSTTTLASPALVNPAGALIYDTSTTGSIGQTGDTDSYTLDINAGQTITLVVTPTGGLQGSLNVTGPGVSQSVTGTAANAPFVAQAMSIATSGTYTFAVSGAASTTGSYTMRVVLNAAAENEAYGGASNNTTGTAQNLMTSAVTLSGGAARLGVLGTMTGGTSQTDVYALSATLGQTLTVSWTGIGTGTMELLDSVGTVLVGAIAGPTNLNYLIANYVVTATSTYYVRVVSTVAGSYAVVATLNASFDTESNHDFANAQDISRSGAVIGSIKAANSGFVPATDALSGPVPLISNFAGPNATGYIPPDPTVAAGPAQVVAVVNTTLAIYDKSTGSQLFAQNMNGATGFFASVGATTTVFDPHALYDFETQRFFVIAVDIAGSTSNIFIAVSKTSTPTGANDWHKYKLDFTHTPSGATAALGSGAHFPDYPKVGVNSDALWIAGNYFAISGGSGTYAGLTAIAKSALLTGGTATKVYEEYFSGFSVFPVHSYGSSPVQYFAETSTGSGSTIRVHAVSNVLTSPTRAVATVTIPSFNTPIDPPQLGGGTGADSVDARIMTGVWRNGQMYVAHAITPVSGDGENVVRWYQIATNNFPSATPTLTQSGNVDPGPGVHAWMPAINVDAQGNMGLAFSIGGATQYYGIGYTGRLSNDPAGTVAMPVSTLIAGQGNYVRTDSFGRNRWGDYAGLALDPNDGATFWAFHEYAATGNNWATRVGSFQLAAPQDEDWYTFSVSAGANLTVVTSTPSDGALAFHNTLDPMLELYDPSGTLVASDANSAGDGRNAQISYFATTSGNYRVRTLASGATRGEYMLRVTGANVTDPAAAVIDTDPDNNSILSAFPTTITLNLSEAVLATSVQASDVTINGVAATAVTRIDGDSYQFTIPPSINTGDRVYSVIAPAGAMTDLQGNTTPGYTGAFTLDGTAPKITSLTYNGGAMPADKVFAAGPLTLVASFTEQLFNNNSPRRGLLSPGSEDVLLINTSTGQTVTGATLTYDSFNNQVTIAFPSLSEGQYALTLISGDNAFEDLVGNNLDGEPNGAGIDGTPTGNGSPGGNYTLTFVVDSATSAFPVPLTAVAPLGSMVYRGTTLTTLSSPADTDELTINLEAGQSISIILDPVAALRPTVTLFGPSGATLGTTTSTVAGSEAILSSAPVTQAGTYRIVIGAVGSGIGVTNVELVLNGTVEGEVHGVGNNNSIATAQDISNDFTSLGGVASRAAVTGTIAAPPAAQYASSVIAFSSQYSTTSWSAARALGAPNVTVYGDQANAWSASSPNAATEFLTLGFSTPVYAHGVTVRESFNNGFVYQVDVLDLNDVLHTVWTGVDNAATGVLADFTATWPVTSYLVKGVKVYVNGLHTDSWEEIDAVQLLSPVTPESDFYSVSLVAGETLSLSVNSSVNAQLLDAASTPLATNVANGSIDRFVAPASGVYYIALTPTSSQYIGYNLVVSRNAAIDGTNDSLAASQEIGPTAVAVGAIAPPSLNRLFVFDVSANQIREIDRQTGTILRSFAAPVAASADYGLATTPTSLLAGGISTGAIYEINPNTGATIRTITNHSIDISGLAFGNNEIYVLTDSVAGRITVLDYTSGAVKRTLNTGLGISEGLAFDGTNILGRSSSSLYAINPVTGATVNTRALSFVQEGIGVIGSELFLAGFSSINVYDLATLAFKRMLSGLNDLEAIGADADVTDSDYYSLAVNAGSTITLTTRTPGDGSGEFNNALDPALELYNPAGALVASNDNGAVDGRNALLTHVATVTGTYKVRVLGASSSGEYVLTMSGGSDTPAPFIVSDSLPANGAVLSSAPTRGSIHFNDGILLSTLTAADVTFQGGPVTGFTVIDGNTIEFDIPSGLTLGSYTIAIAANAIQDLQGTPLSAFSATFSFDNNNDPPNISVPTSIAVNEDQVARILGLDISDADAGTGNISVSLSITHGTLSLITNIVGGVVSGQIVGNGTATISVTAPVSAIRATLAAGPVYRSLANYAGTDRLVIQANDLGNTGGAAQIDIDSAVIAVAEVNDPPTRLTGTIKSLTGQLSDGPRTLGLTGLTYGPGGGVDETAQTLSITVAEVPASEFGTIVRLGDIVPLAVNDVLTISELYGLQFITSGTVAGNGRFRFDVTDNGKTAGVSAPATLTEEVAISVIARSSVSYLGDINATAGNSDPANIVALGNVAIYTAYSPDTGIELWRSDGTDAGTFLLSDVRLGGRNGAIANLTVVGSQVFFTASTPEFGTELWATDGTSSGTRLVRDVSPGRVTSTSGTSSGTSTTFSASGFVNFNGALYFSDNSQLWQSDGTSAGTALAVPSSIVSRPGGLTNVGGTLFFRGTSSATGYELWKTDGTSSGTVLVADLTPGSLGSMFDSLTAIGNVLFFNLSTAANGTELWRSDGTSAGTALVADIGPGGISSDPRFLTNVNGILYFAATDVTRGSELWKSDGTSSGTRIVRDIAAGSAGSSISNLFNHNGTLFFSANDSFVGTELFKSDGTSSGTVLVRDIATSGSSLPTGFATANGKLYFAATANGLGQELYTTDGTSTGTVLVRDTFAGSSSGVLVSATQRPLGVGNLVLFTGNDGLNGRNLWKSDGTLVGTSLVQRSNPATDNINITSGNFLTIDGITYFAADNSVYGRELWKTDGTSAGTQMVADLMPGNASSNPSNFAAVGNRLFFAAVSPSRGNELWVTDGTPGGTSLVYDIFSGTSSSGPSQLRNVNGTLYFAASDGITGSELWASDGTSSGTRLVRDVWPGSTGSSIAIQASLGDIAVFIATDGTNGAELWRSDGTSEGTFLLRDIAPGSNDSFASGFFTVGSQLLFRAADQTNGTELWITDGTTAGTQLVSDINPGISSSNPTNLLLFGNRVLFSATSSATGAELWSTDGTSSGTQLLRDIIVGSSSSTPLWLTEMNGYVYFGTPGSVGHLWRTDGTSTGTVLVSNVALYVQELVNLNGVLLFSGASSGNGFELWRSDGTSTGTYRIDIAPGLADSSPTNFRILGNRAYFRAFEPSTGWELWRSDGTSSGTKIVFDAYAGIGDSYPQPLSIINNRLLMTGTHPAYGTELMVLDDQPVTTSGIPSFDVSIDAPNTILDLTQYFQDDITPSNGLRYTLASNTNPLLFSSATLDELLGGLNLDYAAATTGESTITIRATDAAGYSVTASFTVRVGAAINDAPVNILPVGLSTPEDTAMVVSGISISDTDVGSAALLVTLSAGNGTLALSGLTAGSVSGNGSSTVTIQASREAINAALVSGLSYSPSLNFAGVDTITIHTNDLGNSGSGGPQTDVDSLTISVLNVNDLPVIVLPAATSVAEDTAVFLSGISILDFDNSGPLSVTFTAVNGTLTLSSTVAGGLLPSQITGNGTATITVLASAGNLNATLGDSNGLRFLPTLNFNGAASLSISANDLNLVSGPLLDTDTLAINFSAVNDSPVRTAGSVESSIHYADATVQSLGFADLQYAGGATADEAGQSLTYTLTDVPAPSLGSVVRAGETTPLTAGTNLTLNEIRGLGFVAQQGTSGTATIAFTVLDNGTTSGVPDPRLLTESLTLTVTPRTSITLTRDINQLPANSNPATAVNLNGVAIYSAFDYDHGIELWRSDGSSTGTYLLLDIRPGGRSSSPANLWVEGNAVYFVANDGIAGDELWKTDGTSSGTLRVRDINVGGSGSSIAGFVNVNGVLFFSAFSSSSGTELWRTDGTCSGTYMVKDIAVNASSTPTSVTNVGGRLFFAATDNLTGIELWTSDGTSSGTRLVRDINPGSGTSGLNNFRAAGNSLFFTASNGVNGSELWFSNGTSTGTFLVSDITPGINSSTLGGLVVVNNLLFFSASTSAAGVELWRSDGTSSGTIMLGDIAVGTTSSSPTNMVNWNGVLLFSALGTTAGNELWRSDGTSAGTVLVRDIVRGTSGSSPGSLTVMNGAVYFSAFTSASGIELWRTDGTSSGTVQVFDISSGSTSSAPINLLAVGNSLFFVANDGAHGNELWRSDGTSTGTFLTRDIVAGSANASITNFSVLGNRVLFRSTDSFTGGELWTSDGTSAGTQPLQDAARGTTDALPGNLATMNGIVYFVADDGILGRELWRSDGTMTGTRMVADINPVAVARLRTISST